MARNEGFNIFSGNNKDSKDSEFSRQTFAVIPGLEEATTAVEKAETTKVQSDVDSAMTLVVELGDGEEKNLLVSRLEAVELEIATAEEIRVATEAVVKAETTKLQGDVDSARVIVNTLGDVVEKNSLLERLTAVEEEALNAVNLKTATEAVAKAEASEIQTDVNEARGLVNALSESEEKNALLIRLRDVEAKIEENGLSKYRRNKTMRYGLKEVADVVFFDTVSKEPVILFDTLKVSNIENASESTQATGGKGNAPLIAWDYGRTATLTMQDALLSDQSMAMLAGSDIKDATKNNVMISRHETIAVPKGATKITLQHVPAGEVKVYDSTDGSLGAKVPVTGGVDTKEQTITTPDETNDRRTTVFYESKAPANSSVVTFSSDKFPGTYKVVGTSLVRDEDGMDHPFQFVIPRAKLQSGFTFTMDPENVSTFDFNLEVLVEADTRTLYDVIRLGEDPKE